MPLVDYVSCDAIITDMEAQKRDKSLHTLLDAMVEAGSLDSAVRDDALQALVNRERLGSTAIGNGIAVPHARMEQLDGIAVGIGICPDGVEFNALDGEPAHQIFLVLGPKENPSTYVEVMERITNLVQNADFRRFAMQAQSAAEVRELIEEMDKG
jgi:mannitol/fructose-specific phosphotransferase system IIA component (Ntr-type)